MELAAFIVICGAAAGLGIWLSVRIAQRRGTMVNIPRAKRVRMVAAIAVVFGGGMVAAWLITHGQAAVGIALLVALYVVPNLVVISFRIRESNRRAREARARR